MDRAVPRTNLEFVRLANIERYRRQLSEVTDKTKHEQLLKLLAEEEAKGQSYPLYIGPTEFLSGCYCAGYVNVRIDGATSDGALSTHCEPAAQIYAAEKLSCLPNGNAGYDL